MLIKNFSFDWPIFFLIFLLSFLGLVNFFSASLYYSLVRTGDQYAYFLDFFIKNFILAWLFFALGNILGNRFFKNKALFFVSFVFLYLLLWLTLFTPLGVEINQARRWLKLGPIIFQPSELIKPLAILILGLLLNSNPHASLFSFVFISLSFAFLIVLPIFLQPAGTNSFIIFTSLVFTSFVFLKRFDHFLKYLLILFLIGSIFVFLGIAFWPYRQERILSLITQGVLFKEKIYQIEQSKLAIASGGFWGKGLGKSEMKYLQLPQMLNDSIFAIYAEEFGFLGSIFLLILYILLFLRILKIGFNNPSPEKRSFCLGVFIWFLTQTSFHLLSNLGIFVPTGVVLPFFSSGASSHLAIYFSLGLISSFKK